MSTRYRRNPNTAGRAIDGTGFVITPGDHRVHTLNTAAVEIWQLAADGCTVDEVATHLARVFEVDRETAARDAARCCEDMVGRGILLIEQADGV